MNWPQIGTKPLSCFRQSPDVPSRPGPVADELAGSLTDVLEVLIVSFFWLKIFGFDLKFIPKKP